MIVYEGVKREFLDSVLNDTIASEIEKCVLEKMHKHTVENEFRSWDNSMQYMYKVVSDPAIPEDAGIAIEYNIPQTAKRVDFMISGYDDKDNPGMVIIELKQWEELNKVENTDALVETYTGNGIRKVVHPSYQVWTYSQLIADYNSAVDESDIQLIPCAFLHNYVRKDNDPIDDAQYDTYTSVAPAFTKGQVPALVELIKKFVRKGDNKKVLYLLDHGEIRPSKSLQNAIASMMNGNREFTMIDEQRVVYEEILKLSLKCQKDNKKRTVICKGGPGTGKSVIAVQLLAELTQRNQFVQYVSKNQAPRQVYLQKLKGDNKRSGVVNLFKGSAVYVDVERNKINTLIADEAHRLEERSQYTKKTGNENQIKEIIHAAVCSVFFIDESQRVTMADIGSVNEIKKWAEYEGSEITEMELVSQFRCNGSDGYLAWLDNLLEIRETANLNLDGIAYDFRLVDNPEEVRQLIVEKNREANRARILAGYCWDWPKDGRGDTNAHDIKIGDFEISWNLDDGQVFALSETSVNEAGCIHTTQGLEFDYVGVIIGDDLRYENGKIVTDYTKRARTDQSIKGLKKMDKENHELALARADEIIKNTYRTLMTRGMKGCYVYCTNPGLREYIKSRLGSAWK
ncbi:DUF2075 domain-containing protein [Schwartzia succinivorans]|uniref:Schlafen group 3-like DNA/RNA helicase domain-containing protein n=1 Tax=Schwartzia succinivorans DSM 10502 TaxID=1123243 RepID=A0A1M4YNG9_9FIRM|nr:DUF2075 domain-containing protein [Schwartzia succinivorans]SHF07208.1 hypothetical protein SAMN02745190_01817 [Schwartzia succinivorans DSM 10502]